MRRKQILFLLEFGKNFVMKLNHNNMSLIFLRTFSVITNGNKKSSCQLHLKQLSFIVKEIVLQKFTKIYIYWILPISRSVRSNAANRQDVSASSKELYKEIECAVSIKGVEAKYLVVLFHRTCCLVVSFCKSPIWCAARYKELKVKHYSFLVHSKNKHFSLNNKKTYVYVYLLFSIKQSHTINK